MEKQLIKQTEKIENLHKDGFKIIQDGKRFKFGIDAVLLADFAKARKTEYVIDLGTGTGIIPIL
ncbi:MAG: SAM-dependent methyltransferase, partial [Treponema porcinum]|nr:SAM-dependent methyltransferase [Treponema porcinum]